MAFTQKYEKILSPFLETYKTAKNEKARKKASKKAAEAVKKSSDLQEDKEVPLPKELETVCPFFKPFPFSVNDHDFRQYFDTFKEL